MIKNLSVLRSPDAVYSATEASPYRFEEKGTVNDAPVSFEYQVSENCARVMVYPGGSPVKYLKLRFNGDFRFVEKVMGDQWERAGGYNAPMEWRCPVYHRVLPWYVYAIGDGKMVCYGVKTGPDCFAFWQIDPHGVTLFLNLTNGSRGTDLKEELCACEVVEMGGELTGPQDSFKMARAFCAKMCEHPVSPKSPVFGVNNWYWAYGRISQESVLVELDYLKEMTRDASGMPYLIMDDGWQLNRTYCGRTYIGGPWIPNAKFPDMPELIDKFHQRGVKAGLWFRPLLTMGEIPEEAFLLNFENGGQFLDPSHPYTIERITTDAARIAGWGTDLIKHDFSTMDLTGFAPLSAVSVAEDMVKPDRVFFDQTRTTATIIKDLYKAVQNGAGQADVIGCNVIGHLSAGIHSIQRVGDDTSGRSFEWTRRDGINAMMRLPQNGTFFNVDPDCAAFTDRVDAELNLDFLEVCARTGMTALASVTPGILTAGQMKRIQGIYKLAAERCASEMNPAWADAAMEIADFDKTAYPENFISPDGRETVGFDWSKAYDGARVCLSWMN